MSGPQEYRLLGSWDSYGVPKYLSATNIVSPDTIYRLINLLPEATNETTYNPTLFTSSRPTDIIIQSTDPSFVSTNVSVTFLYEGAGYKNVFGYYVFPLNPININNLSAGYYKVPTKPVYSGNTLTGYTPMTYADRDLVDNNGKSILKKTVIFPNSSMASGWWTTLNGTASGGNLLPGMEVQLKYDVDNNVVPFPNNTGIGFFVIPNGWSGPNFTNANARLYTDSVFNPGQYNQSIAIYDAQGSTADQGSMLICFEDLVLPGGDKDYNDICFLVKWTNGSCVNTTNANILPPSGGVTTDDFIIDNTGIYYQMKESTYKSYQNDTSTSYYKFIHSITCDKSHDAKVLYDIFNTMTWEVNTSISFTGGNGSGGDDDEHDSKIITITFNYPRNLLQNYNYFMCSYKNRLQRSPNDRNHTNIVDFQGFYINGGMKINGQSFKCTKSDNTEKFKNDNFTPNTSRLTGPRAMGDPHITTISGEKYYIPNFSGFLNLYTNSEIAITCELETHPDNDLHPEYRELTFIKKVAIKRDRDVLIIDTFVPDHYYVVDNGNEIRITEHSSYKFSHEDEYKDLAAKSREKYNEMFNNKNDMQFRYVSFNTAELGNVLLELMFVPDNKELINGVYLTADGIWMSHSYGALVNKRFGERAIQSLY